MNVTGKAKVYSFESKGNYAKASLQIGKKKQDGTWDNMWFNAKFVGKNAPSAIEKGQQINITSAVLESFKGGKGTFVTVVIFEYEGVGSKSVPQSDQGLQINDDELPF